MTRPSLTLRDLRIRFATLVHNYHIIKCTGDNDYKSMKPYINIVDEIKASEMNKMNFMD